MVPQRPPTCRPNTSQRAISTTVELTVHLPAPPGGSNSSSSSSSSSDGFFPRTFLRPHNVSHCRKLPRPRGAYGVLAERQLAHLTGTRLAHQAAAACPDSKRGAGDGSLQGNRQHTPPPARPALVCSGGAQGWGATDTEPE